MKYPVPWRHTVHPLPVLTVGTGLLDVTLHLEDVVLALGEPQSQAQRAVRLAFRPFLAECMSTSWGSWLTVLFQLLRLGLLPPSMSALDDFCHRTGFLQVHTRFV